MPFRARLELHRWRDNGVHTAQSDVPFGLTVWGWDTQVSYAYPAGMGVKPINQVVVPIVVQ